MLRRLPVAPRRRALPLLLSAMLATPLAQAQTAPPQDRDYPGTLSLAIDATDLAHRVFHATQKIPVQPGPLTLLYPQWIPGNHSPSGPVNRVAGLKIQRQRPGASPGAAIRSTSTPSSWSCPRASARWTSSFEVLTPTAGEQGRITMTQDMLNLQWNQVALYPAGHYAQRDPDRADAEAARRLAGRHGAGSGQPRRRHAALQAGSVRHAARFAGVRRPLLQAGRPRPGREGAGATEHRRRRSEVPRSQARADRGAPQAGRPGIQALRRAPLRPLRLPVLAVRPDGRQRPGAPALERERRRPRVLHRLGQERGRPRPAAARVHPLLERQVPSPGRPDHAQLQRADERHAAVGVRGPDPVLGLRAGRALGPVEPGAGARCAGAGRRDLQQRSPRLCLAQRAGHHARSDHQLAPAAALPQLAAERGLLQRRPADLAGGRRQAARTQRRQALARRFRQGVLRRQGRRLERQHVRLRRSGAHARTASPPYDWASFLRERVDANAPPLDGLAASGWKLVYTDTPSEYQKGIEGDRKLGRLQLRRWACRCRARTPRSAACAGTARRSRPASRPGSTLLAVNGYAFENDRLKDAIKANRDGARPIELVVEARRSGARPCASITATA